MKIKSIILVLSSIFFSSFLFSAEQNFVELRDLKHWDVEFPIMKLPEIPKPKLPMLQAGDYYEDLKEMEKLLKEKKHIEFYKKAVLLSEKKRSDREIQRMEGRQTNATAWAVSYYWWQYFVLTAPILTGKEMKPEFRGKWAYFGIPDGVGPYRTSYRGTEIDLKVKKMQYGRLKAFIQKTKRNL